MKRSHYISEDSCSEDRFVYDKLKEIPEGLPKEKEEDELFTAVLSEMSEADRLRMLLFCAKRGRIHR